jgi:hypothetical protein
MNSIANSLITRLKQLPVNLSDNAFRNPQVTVQYRQLAESTEGPQMGSGQPDNGSAQVSQPYVDSSIVSHQSVPDSHANRSSLCSQMSSVKAATLLS